MSVVPQKIRILKYTAEQGAVSLEDVVAHLKDAQSSSSIRVSMHQMGLGRMKYGKVRHGVWFIKDQGHIDEVQSYFPQMPPVSPASGIPIPQIPHFLELNRIRNVFDNSTSFKVAEWIPEAVLKSLPVSQRDGFNSSNIPDAVFWRIKTDGSRQKYFLEFERSLKNSARYKDIFTTYSRRKDIGHKNVIYICKDDALKDRLRRIEQKLAESGYLDAFGKYFQFVTLKGFYKTCGCEHPQEEE